MYLFKNDFDKRLIYQGHEMRVKNGIKDALSFTIQTSRNIYQPLLEQSSNRNNILINENQTLNNEKDALITQNERILQRSTERKRRDAERIGLLKKNINDIRNNGYNAFTQLTNDYIIESARKPETPNVNDIIDLPKTSGEITFARTLKDVGTRLNELGIESVPSSTGPVSVNNFGRNNKVFNSLITDQHISFSNVNQNLAQTMTYKREYVFQKDNYLYKIKANKRQEDIKTFQKSNIFGSIEV